MNLEKTYEDYVKEHGGIRTAARALGIPRSTFRDNYKKELREKHLATFTSYSPSSGVKIPFPNEDEPNKVFILTSAQDQTKVHEPFLRNLKAFAEHLDASIYIGGYTYNKSLFEDHDKNATWFHPLILDHMIYDKIEIGNWLFLGNMNTLPTATKPLSGFETYTQDKNGIFPHPKVQLTSVPTHKEDAAKTLMTTGSITVPNYVQKKAGIKAQFHHVIGAVILEICSDGASFARHIVADEDGNFQDLNCRVDSGVVTYGHRVEAISYGDIHHEKIDKEVAKATWGYYPNQDYYNPVNLLDFLKPKFQFFHDLSDFSPRNHHNINDIHFRFQSHFSNNNNNVEDALLGCANFLDMTSRPWCESLVVESNHDQALLKWLKTADFKTDPENAIFYLETQLALYKAMYDKRDINIFEHVLRGFLDLPTVTFLDQDESYLVGDVEYGFHGHLGANGAKPNPQAFTKIGRKTTSGHTHSPQIIDGSYVNGTSSKLDMGYNAGCSSWQHAHTIQYPNGKRAILIMSKGRFFG